MATSLRQSYFFDDIAREWGVNHFHIDRPTSEEAIGSESAARDELVNLLKSKAGVPCRVLWSLDPGHDDGENHVGPSVAIGFHVDRPGPSLWPDDVDKWGDAPAEMIVT